MLFMAEVEVDTATERRGLYVSPVLMMLELSTMIAVNGQAYGGISHSIGFAK